MPVASAPVFNRSPSRELDALLLSSRRNARSAPMGLHVKHALLSADIVREQAGLFRRLECLYRAGISPADALDTERKRAGLAASRVALHDLAESARDGEPLSAALLRHEAEFGKLAAPLVRTGEETGRIAEAFDSLATHLEWESELRRKLSLWSLQAKILFVVAMFVLPALMAFMTAPNPALIILMLALRLALFVGVLYAAASLWRWVRFSFAAVERAARHALFRIPLVGKAHRKFAWTRFARALADLANAGVPPGQALELAANVSRMPELEDRARVAAALCRGGASLSGALSASGVTPAEFAWPLSTGEMTGEVVEMLQRGAERLEFEAEESSMQAAFVFSQILYLGVALAVTGLAASGIAAVVRVLAG